MLSTLPPHNPDQPMQAEAVINLQAIRANTMRFVEATSAEVMAVVKADGYGHGMLPAAKATIDGGASWLGACTVPEALALREAGFTEPIFAWLVAPNVSLAPALRADIDLSVSSQDFLALVVAAARETGCTARIHLKLDTGLGRNGCTPTDWPELLVEARKAQAEQVVEIVGVWSHYACADEPGHPSITTQLDIFTEGLAAAQRIGIRPQMRHIANSAGSLTLPHAHYDMIRPGISLYGYSPMPRRESEFGLTPAMTLRGQVLLAKRVPAGHGVSYGLTYLTPQETTLALVGLGYADGIPRAASDRGPLQLGGARRRIAGRVCMDQIVVDVGDDEVAPGDIATLFGPGTSGEPTANDWAELLDTISYEIVTRIGTRVVRTYHS